MPPAKKSAKRTAAKTAKPSKVAEPSKPGKKPAAKEAADPVEPPPVVRFTYVICVPQNPPSLLRFTVEVSNEMATWIPLATKAPGAPWTQWTGAGEVFPPVPAVPDLVCITIADCEPISAHRRRFMRVRVGP